MKYFGSLTLVAVTTILSLAADEMPMSGQSQQMMSGDPCCKNRFFVEADFIYWLAKQEGNDYAATGAALVVPGTTNAGNSFVAPSSLGGEGKVYAPHTKMSPGFKAAAGVDLAHGGWDLFAEYTWLFNETQSSVSSTNQNAGILPLFSYTPVNSVLKSTMYATPTSGTNFVSSASANWDLHFNNINLELGRWMYLFSCFSLRPHFGLQGTWQHQTFRADYAVSSDTDTFVGNNVVNYNQKSWGIGLRGGLDSMWDICNHLGLFVNTSVSALWSYFKGTGTSFDTNTTTGDTHFGVEIANQVNRMHTLCPVIGIEGGLQFDWAFCNGYQFYLQAGWEEQVWFYQNQHSSAIANTSLILQGLTVKARLDF